VNELIWLLVLGPGILAPADPLVLETVEVRRVRHGWGLTEFASPGTVRVAVEDCGLLGWWGVIVTEEGDVLDCYVVDCQQGEHEALSDRGIVADVSKAELGHQRAVLVLSEERWRSPSFE
jgi:hypothetical protein